MKYSATAPVKIIVLGAGGTGGYLIPHLYRIAFSDENRDYRIIICDGDIVERKNLIRQNFIEQDIGRNKASVLAERYAGAFGIECEYIPEYIESEQRLKELVRPDFTKSPWTNARETQRVILIGCVDNNKSRAICHKVFYETKDLVYIDSGNGEHTGQVVCGIRQNGRTTFKPVGTLYPDILKAEDKLPTELSCAERAVSAPQSVTANLTAATEILASLEEYVSKRTELLAEELKMPNVSITLFEPVKTTGELKSVFRFAYKGRNYAALSLSERTAAGLEICALMRRLTGLNFPMFIDNTESVAHFDMSSLTCQTVFLRMVKNAPLSVKSMNQATEPLKKAS